MSAGSRPRPIIFDYPVTEKKVKAIEKRIGSPDFWRDQKIAAETLAELSRFKDKIGEWEKLNKELENEKEELKAIGELKENQELLLNEDKRLAELEKIVNVFELARFFSGPYDAYSAIVGVTAGAGGRDADDWTGMLLRMYSRLAERRGWKTNLLHEHRDPDGGVKSASFEVLGANVYGWLKRETGPHRLVRISPFDSSKRRHTSFAGVSVLPILPKNELSGIVIKPEEVEMQMARSSGPGGQNVNRRETAVRLLHKPTGLVAECQSERTQALNREKALGMLRIRVFAKVQQDREQKLAKEKGERTSAAFGGTHIRSYILHPYKLVKDVRTGVESHDPEEVLNGNLDLFLEAEVKLR